MTLFELMRSSRRRFDKWPDTARAQVRTRRSAPKRSLEGGGQPRPLCSGQPTQEEPPFSSLWGGGLLHSKGGDRIVAPASEGGGRWGEGQRLIFLLCNFTEKTLPPDPPPKAAPPPAPALGPRLRCSPPHPRPEVLANLKALGRISSRWCGRISQPSRGWGDQREREGPRPFRPAAIRIPRTAGVPLKHAGAPARERERSTLGFAMDFPRKRLRSRRSKAPPPPPPRRGRAPLSPNPQSAVASVAGPLPRKDPEGICAARKAPVGSLPRACPQRGDDARGPRKCSARPRCRPGTSEARPASAGPGALAIAWASGAEVSLSRTTRESKGLGANKNRPQPHPTM